MFFNFTQPDIPATQDTSQLKYISQRSAASQRTQESQDVGFKIPATSNTAYTVFDKLMQKCSVDLISSDTATIGKTSWKFERIIKSKFHMVTFQESIDFHSPKQSRKILVKMTLRI